MERLLKIVKETSESEMQSNIESGVECAAKIFNEEDCIIDLLKRKHIEIE